MQRQKQNNASLSKTVTQVVKRKVLHIKNTNTWNSAPKKIKNSAHVTWTFFAPFWWILCTFQANFSTLKLSAALLYDPVCPQLKIYITVTVTACCSWVVWLDCNKGSLLLLLLLFASIHRTAKYFVTFTPKCFALAVAVGSAELRAILRIKFAKFYHFWPALLILRTTANSAHTESQNSDTLTINS